MDRPRVYNASEISQRRKTNTLCCHLHMESKRYNKLVYMTKRKQTHRYREKTSGYQWEREGGSGKIGIDTSTNSYV